MRTYVYPADMTGCGYYRLIWAAEHLRSTGHDVRVVTPNLRNASFRATLDAHGNMVDVHVPEDADVIVLQRITHKYLVDAIKILRSRGIAVVIDMDDDLSAINPNNPAFREMHPTLAANKDHNWQNAQRACDIASYVTVSTPALLERYAVHGRGHVLYNCVPQRYLDVERVDSDVIGWGGSVHSHPDDLQVAGIGVAQVATREGEFRVVGPREGVRSALRLNFEPNASGPVEILNEWPRNVAQLGIGIAPLSDTRFNAAKSWLKPLEYSALGVPWVASPRVEYRRLHERGVGLLAEKPKQWAARLRELRSSVTLRAEMSQRGREVARELTIEGNAWRWYEAWTQAYKIER